jgi:hypothetical protein
MLGPTFLKGKIKFKLIKVNSIFMLITRIVILLCYLQFKIEDLFFFFKNYIYFLIKMPLSILVYSLLKLGTDLVYI